jgi:rare lipoprotein A
LTKIIIVLAFLLPIGVIAQEKKESVTTVKNGIASYYADHFEGQKTSNGETFTQKALTAASNFFKLNTFVRVTNLLNNETVIVKITDRMHPRMAKAGRVVDLSTKAAKDIKMFGKGLVKVIVELVPNGSVE